MRGWKRFWLLLGLSGALLFLAACEEGVSPQAAIPRTPSPSGSVTVTPRTVSTVTPVPRRPFQTPGTPAAPLTPTSVPCGLFGSLASSGSSEVGVWLLAAPQPVAPGKSLFYCVTLDASRYEVPVPLRFYLPEAVSFLRAEGVAWTCEEGEAEGARFLDCRNMAAGRVVPPLKIEVTVASSSSGRLQACVEVQKPPFPQVCLTTDVE